MIIKDSRQFYYDASGMASQIGRQLTLAGIAILWLLAGGLREGRIMLTNRLLWAGWALVLYLVLDLFQYLYKTTAWAIWTGIKERRLHPASEDSDVGKEPRAINAPTWILFCLKMATLMVGFAVLLWVINNRIK
jgi:hypothetical protein